MAEKQRKVKLTAEDLCLAINRLKNNLDINEHLGKTMVCEIPKHFEYVDKEGRYSGSGMVSRGRLTFTPELRHSGYEWKLLTPVKIIG